MIFKTQCIHILEYAVAFRIIFLFFINRYYEQLEGCGYWSSKFNSSDHYSHLLNRSNAGELIQICSLQQILDCSCVMQSSIIIDKKLKFLLTTSYMPFINHRYSSRIRGTKIVILYESRYQPTSILPKKVFMTVAFIWHLQCSKL